MILWFAAVGMSWLVAATSAQPPQAPKKVDLIEYIQAGYAGLKADLTAAAEAMPESDYGFKPTAMPEVRTFGETILHVATAQFNMCARLRGVPTEPGHKVEPGNKADVLKTLAASFVVDG
jgi:hypothetical protein